jgi:7-carboxy-7-deazaguanine synthase
VKIADIYQSRQGEGLLTGAESVFVRSSGCNLRCWFCDTPYTSWSPEGEDLSVEEILISVDRMDCRHVVITGGEPMLYAELVPLAEGLHGMGRHITIETAGTLYLPVFCDLMSISPKLSNSTPPAARDRRWRHRHEHARHAPQVVRRLMNDYEYQLKFVIDTPEDCDEVLRYLDEFSEVDRSRVMLMPQGTSCDELAERGAWLEPNCLAHGFVFCPRQQIEWFGLARRT